MTTNKKISTPKIDRPLPTLEIVFAMSKLWLIGAIPLGIMFGFAMNGKIIINIIDFIIPIAVAVSITVIVPLVLGVFLVSAYFRMK